MPTSTLIVEKIDDESALVLSSPDGNVLWDCVTYLDDDLLRRDDAPKFATIMQLNFHLLAGRWPS